MVGKAPTKSQIKVLIRSIYLQNREALRSNRECWAFIVLAFVVTDNRARYISKKIFFSGPLGTQLTSPFNREGLASNESKTKNISLGSFNTPRLLVPVCYK